MTEKGELTIGAEGASSGKNGRFLLFEDVAGGEVQAAARHQL